jgi:hypothetical protein
VKVLRPTAVFVAGVLFGILIWRLSPAFTGRVEPWDAPGQHYYLAALFLAGALAAVPSPRWFTLGALGVCVGQCVHLGHLLSITPSAFGPLGMIFAAGYSVIALLGGGCVWMIAGRIRKKSEPQ